MANLPNNLHDALDGERYYANADYKEGIVKALSVVLLAGVADLTEEKEMDHEKMDAIIEELKEIPDDEARPDYNDGIERCREVLLTYFYHLKLKEI